MSKRHGDATTIDGCRRKGFLPEAVLNYLALLGWNPGSEQEIFSHDELVKLFDLSGVQSGGAQFDEKKLIWFNRAHIRKLSPDELVKRINAYTSEEVKKQKVYQKVISEPVIPVIAERIETLEDAEQLLKTGEMDFYGEAPTYDSQALLWHKDPDVEKTKTHLTAVLNYLSDIPESDFTADRIKEEVWDYASKEGRGNVLWPMRFALSGKKASPDPFTLAVILGKKETLKRLEIAMALLSKPDTDI